jgi:eukaryotic-like serine/threonine-protein kinase
VTPAPQASFGDYQLVAEVARGGQGVVYQARHVRSGRAVALKLLADPSPSAVKRFRQEARVLARLLHPNVLRVLEHGEFGGTPFIATELVNGEDLATRVKAFGPPPGEEGARLLATLAHAVDYCHGLGVVHRDLKPGNVLIEAGSGRPVLIDFGLAKRDAAQMQIDSLDALSAMSQAGAVKGTPGYMAPEQINPREFGEAGALADVYALGALLFFLLTGEPPFTGEALAIVLREVTRKPPRDPRELNPAAPAALAQLCLHALSKQPSARPTSAAAFADALAKAGGFPGVAPQPLSAPSSPVERDSSATRAESDVALLPSRTPSTTLPQSGQTFAGFQIMAELGRGGMGAVYRARDLEAGRDVALKVTLGRLSPRVLGRFQREGELTARLNHPGIVRVHSSGDIDGRPYLAYELVDGTNFSEVIDALDLRARVSVIRDAARALGYAHQHGVVHRDVKGENILVDSEGRGHVADFGLATAQDLERLTQTGTLLGTPAFMSPEQVDGRGESPRPPSDVWSLGVLLYKALTDELPIQGAIMIEMVGQILAGAFDRPRSVKADVPVGLEQICLRALENAPADRYPDGEALAGDLDAWLAGDYRATRSAKPALGALAVVAGVVLVGLAVTAWPEGTPAFTQPPKPTALPIPVNAPPPVPLGVLRLARAQLANFDTLDARARVRSVQRWLKKNKELPVEVRALGEEVARKAQLEFPVLEIRHSRSTKVYTGDATQAFRVKGFYLSDDKILTQGADNRLRCWNVAASPTLEWEMECGDPVTSGLAVHPDGKAFVVAMGIENGEVHAVDATTRQARVVPGGFFEGVEVRSVAFSPDGKTLLLGAVYQGVYQYRWPSLEFVRRLEVDLVRDLDVSPDNRLLAVCGGPWKPTQEKRGFLRVWSLDSGKLELERLERTMHYRIVFDPSGESLITGTQAGVLFSFKLDDPSTRRAFVAPSDEGGAAEFTRGGAHGGTVTGLAFSQDGRTLFSTSTRSGPGKPAEFRVWDLDRHAQVRVSLRMDTGLLSLSSSHQGDRVVVGTGTRTVEVHLAQPK